jgi:hypothetical protein
VIVDSVSPGFCHSTLRREFRGLNGMLIRVMERILCRETSEGAKTIVWAALGGHEDPATLQKLRGGYSSDCKVMEVSDFVLSKEGQEAESRIWVSTLLHGILPCLPRLFCQVETLQILEKADPRVGVVARQYLKA